MCLGYLPVYFIHNDVRAKNVVASLTGNAKFLDNWADEMLVDYIKSVIPKRHYDETLNCCEISSHGFTLRKRPCKIIAVRPARYGGTTFARRPCPDTVSGFRPVALRPTLSCAMLAAQ